MATEIPSAKLLGQSSTLSGDARIDRAKAILIPWDPESEEHVQRLKEQRIACGWKVEQVESWRQLQKDGKMGIHWIVLPSAHPETTNRLKVHTTAFSSETTLLDDTNTTILSRPHTPDPAYSTFLPVGHISLDSWSPKPQLRVSGADGVYSISTFYVSKPLQAAGLGKSAMDICELMAKDDFGAKAITLDTLANEEYDPESPRRIAMGRGPPPKVKGEDWYLRRGYVSYDKVKEAYFDTDPTGKVWPAMAVFMRKELL